MNRIVAIGFLSFISDEKLQEYFSFLLQNKNPPN